MINVWPGVWNDLRAVQRAVWPEVQQNVHEVVVKRLNWANLVTRGEMKVPYCVFECEPEQESDEWAMDSVTYEITVRVHYVAEAKSKIKDAVRERTESYAQRLITAPSLLTSMQVTGHFSFNDTATSPANMAMVEANMPYMVGTVGFRALCGYVVTK